MSKVSTKALTGSIKVPKNAKVKVSKSQQMKEIRERENQRRITEKCEILDQYDTSEQIFTRLQGEISTLVYDESTHDLSVRDDYNFGVEYEVELLLEVLSDLRWYTRYTKDEDDESITDSGLDYIRQYWKD